ncbi:ABC transporter permease [Sphingomonas sp. ASV193]|uniref:ABC transporter permease n=1 Tax=Sphingomonas sp. ASV193 TaxID=3144405 RepID=UPI0032E8FEF7
MRIAETLRAAAVIARRDFKATVMSRAFIFFLLGPMFPVLIGVVFGGIGAKLAKDAPPPKVAVTWPATRDFDQLRGAYDRLSPLFVQGKPPFTLSAAPGAKAHDLFATDKPPAAVLAGSLDQPHLSGMIDPGGATAVTLDSLLEEARRDRAAGLPADAGRASLRVQSVDDGGAAQGDRTDTARAAQFLLFFLTLFLSTMTLSQLIEEKSNKVIEVLAAAVPVDSIFLGKLVAMLGASLVGVAVWLSIGAVGIKVWLGGYHALPTPGVGWPAFIALTFLYFATAYLILGALFLGIGAQAQSAREVQTLSMPVTFSQIVLFAFASAGIADPNGHNALLAAFVPLSSPFAMIARAAELDPLWPHLLALGWQLLWVAIILRFVSGRFRRAVLKSGPSRRPFWKKRAA